MYNVGCSIDYSRVLRIETDIARTVVNWIISNDGVYIPPDLVTDRFIHCAMDNIDFCEDTIDGRRTFHGTAVTVYQDVKESDRHAPISLASSNNLPLPSLEDALPKILSCTKPTNWNTCCPEPVVSNIVQQYGELLHKAICFDSLWFLLRRSILNGNDISISSPTWIGYNSYLGDVKCVSRVSLLPVIPEPPTNSSVQLTVMRQLEKLNESMNKTTIKVVVTADMAIYKPLKQLEMAKEDCKGKWILKPGELHIIIAQLRTIGEFVCGSGIPELWVECDLYSSVTMKQILEGRHIRRAIEAHLTTTTTLNILLLEEFDKEQPGKITLLQPLLDELAVSLQSNNESNIKQKHDAVISFIKENRILEEIKRFVSSRKSVEPVFKMACSYMDMVQSMLCFIRSVRTSDWNLSLASLHDFLKYFFAFNRLNYARMISLYLAEMDVLQLTDPDIWKNVIEGKWVVNRNAVPFCALGADEALEHQNRKLKLQGGLHKM